MIVLEHVAIIFDDAQIKMCNFFLGKNCMLGISKIAPFFFKFF